MSKLYYKLKCCLLFCLLVTNFALAAIEGLKCQRTGIFDTELMVIAQDFGSNGIPGILNITITNPLQVGAVVSVVTKSDVIGSVNLLSDDDIYIIHVSARIEKNELVINTSKISNIRWHSDVKLANPVQKGAKTTTTLVYEVEGYRIFVNGKEIAFYKHRTWKTPRFIVVAHDYIYKALYMTTRESGKQMEVSIF